MIDIDDMDGCVNRLGASLYFDPVAVAHGAEHGVADVFALYGAGRAGVMGDVTVDVVVATFGFFHPPMVEEVWAGLAIRPSQVARIYAEGMAAAARRRWDRDAAGVVATLGREAVDGASSLGLPLFAGWRAMPVPSDPVGAAAVTVMALRELRGDVNIQSVAGAGLLPLEAEMACRGTDYAVLHGWPEPHPDPEAHRPALARADEATHRRMAAAYAPLGERLADLDAALATLSAG